MKRIAIIALVVAAFALCDTVVAQGKFSAWNQGNLFLYNKVGDAEPTNGWGPDWNNTTGIDQEWNFSYSGKDYGFSGTIEFGMSDFSDGASPYDLGWFETYFKFSPELTLSLGRLRMYDYTFISAVEGCKYLGPFANKEFGAALRASPIQGLSLGLFVNVPISGVYAQTHTGDSWAQISTASSIDYLNNLVAGASYAMPSLGTFVAQYSTITKAASLGLRTSLIPKVHAFADYQICLADSSSPTHKILASAGSSLGALSLNSDFAAAYASSAFKFAGELQAEYALGLYALGLLAARLRRRQGRQPVQPGLRLLGRIRALPLRYAQLRQGLLGQARLRLRVGGERPLVAPFPALHLRVGFLIGALDPFSPGFSTAGARARVPAFCMLFALTLLLDNANYRPGGEEVASCSG